MSKFLKKTKKIISTTIVLIAMVVTGQMKTLAADTTSPTVTPRQAAGEIKAGSELKFNIKDDDRITYIFYGWNRRIDKNKYEMDTLATPVPEHEFKITAPTKPGLYEFSIAAQDYTGNISTWMNIPYVVKDKLTGVVDDKEPEFIFDVESGEYPYSNDEIEQGRIIKFRLKDDSGIYYVGYKWSKDEKSPSYTEGATYIYKKDVIQLTAPTEPGVWYLQLYARDGADNLSTNYFTKLIVKDKIAPTVTLNGPSEVEVPLNGVYNDPGAKFQDNYDKEKTIQANEKLDTTKVGKQVLTYSATDAAGNPSNVVTRTVNVVGTITEADLSVVPSNLIYNGQTKTITTSMLNGKTADISVSYEGDQVNAGTFKATITATGNGYYKGTVTIEKEYIITADDITEADVSVVEPSNLVYDGKAKIVTASMLNGKTADVTITYDGENIIDGKAVEAGEYTVTITFVGNGNYKGTITKTVKFTIDVDMTALDAIEAELSKLVESDYTADSYKAITDAIAAAKEIKLQSEFNKAVAEIDLDNLVLATIDTSALEVIESELYNLIENDYTAESYKSIVDAIASAYDIKLQSKFNEAVAEIKLTDLIAKDVDMAALTAIEAELAKLVESDYTADSYKAIKRCLGNARDNSKTN